MPFNNYSRFYQKSNSSASPFKLSLNNHQNRSPQGLYGRLKPILLSNCFVLITGSIARRCHCGHCRVEASQDEKASQDESVTIWRCKQCGIPRLARRQKSDAELILEILAIPKLRGWDATFAREMQRKDGGLGTKQREKLLGIAQKLGISLEYNCSLSDVEGGEA
jgi:hypothetical protein